MKKPVQVEIQGQKLSLRSDMDPRHVQRAAELVNLKMEELLASSERPLPEVKVAILAALNIADEYLQALERDKTVRSDMKERVDRLADVVEAQLEEVAAFGRVKL